jgi:uncharacterized membrane-anchored protein
LPRLTARPATTPEVGKGSLRWERHTEFSTYL